MLGSSSITPLPSFLRLGLSLHLELTDWRDQVSANTGSSGWSLSIQTQVLGYTSFLRGLWGLESGPSSLSALLPTKLFPQSPLLVDSLTNDCFLGAC